MDDKRLENLASEFKTALDAQLSGDYGCEFRLPSREAVAQICRHYLGLLFPVFYQGQGAELDARGDRSQALPGSRLKRYCASNCALPCASTGVAKGISLPPTLRIVPRS